YLLKTMIKIQLIQIIETFSSYHPPFLLFIIILIKDVVTSLSEPRPNIDPIVSFQMVLIKSNISAVNLGRNSYASTPISPAMVTRIKLTPTIPYQRTPFLNN